MRDTATTKSDLIRSFTVEELVLATKKFSNCCLIEAGGFAKVSGDSDRHAYHQGCIF